MEPYELAKPFGRPRRWKNADELWEAFIRYVRWNDENPMVVGNQLARSKKGLADIVNARKDTIQRPMSITAFRFHAGIKREWCIFKADYSKRSQDFCRVINAIEQSIRQQQVDNALVGNYKENLVARLNGIQDSVKQEVKAEVEERGQLSVQQARDFMNQLEKEI